MQPFIVAICGSPRSGNTDSILTQAVKGAESAGARVKVIHLRELEFKGCCGWTNCFYEGFCAVSDDMQSLYKDLFQAQGWILASPNYFNSVTGLMKDFIDRTNPFALKKRFADKKAIVLTCGGWSLDSIQWTENYLREVCRIHKIEVIDTHKVKADHKGEAQEQKQALQECFKLGKKLAQEIREVKK